MSTFYALDSIGFVDTLHAAYSVAVDMFPTDVHWQVENTGDVIESTTGVITGAWINTPVPSIAGTAAGAYSAPSGGMVGWETETIVDGRRLRGKTFFVPLSAVAYAVDGSLTDIAVGRLQAIGSNVLDTMTGSLVIWHRPAFGPRPVGGGPRPIVRPGFHGLVTGSRVPDKSVVLRTRRD